MEILIAVILATLMSLPYQLYRLRQIDKEWQARTSMWSEYLRMVHDFNMEMMRLMNRTDEPFDKQE